MTAPATRALTPATCNRDRTRALVDAGRARAALVFDGDDCVGWRQYGPPHRMTRDVARPWASPS